MSQTQVSSFLVHFLQLYLHLLSSFHKAVLSLNWRKKKKAKPTFQLWC